MDYNNYNNNNGNGGQGSDPYRQPSSENGYGANSGNPYGGSGYANNGSNYNNGGSGYNNNGSYNNNGGYNNPYGDQRKPPKEKKKGGMAAFIGKCAAGAAVFGLVASLVFTGVNSGLSMLTGSSDSGKAAEENRITTNVSQTATGSAKDITDVSGIADEVMPSIVAITNVGTVTYQSFFGSQQAESESAGSGIIIKQNDKYLYIVTNNHVVANSKTLTVQFSDGNTAVAEITGADPSDDLAVIQLKLGDIPEETLKVIKVATVGDSKSMKVGQATIAIGNALGYGQSVTTGVVSAKGRTVSTQDENTQQVITNTNLIQTSAAINPGNSGGALLNQNGEVIGINSVKYASTGVEGIGYAIPMEDAVGIIEALINGDQLPKNAFFGVSGEAVSSDLTSKFNIPTGVYVNQVIANSAAEAAGIKKGDIIVAMDGTKIRSWDELRAIIAGHKEGDKVKVKLARMSKGGFKTSEVEVTLGATTENSKTDNRNSQGQQGGSPLQPGGDDGDGSGIEDYFDSFFGN